MSVEAYIAGLVAAITSMATVITILFKTLIAAKDEIVKTKDAQLAYREQIIASKDAQIAALQVALNEKDQRLDKSIDTLGDAVRMLEAGPQLPPQPQLHRGSGGSGR